jgi:hypothetical protein
MMSENSDVIVKSIENGENPCNVVISGDGYALVGKGVLHKIEPGKGRKRGRYKKVTPRMIYAAEVLTTFGFRPLELMELFGLARRTAYEVSKKAKAEVARKMAASEREYQERERISAASLREDWQDRPGKVEATRMREGYSLREVRSFKQ